MAKASKFFLKVYDCLKTSKTTIQSIRWNSKYPGCKACLALAVILTGQLLAATVFAENLNSVTGNVNFGITGQVQVIATDRSGSIVSNARSNRLGNFMIELPLDNAFFPIAMRAVGKQSLLSFRSPDFTPRSYALTPSDSTINLNLFTTFIVKTAQAASEGLTKASLDEAKDIVLKQLSFGVDSEAVPDPISTRLEDENIDKLIAVNEILDEWLRRIYETLMVAGYALSKDRIIESLASDLTDEVIDGVGPDADARVAASANLVATEMIFEIVHDRLALGQQNTTSVLTTCLGT